MRHDAEHVQGGIINQTTSRTHLPERSGGASVLCVASYYSLRPHHLRCAYYPPLRCCCAFRICHSASAALPLHRYRHRSFRASPLFLSTYPLHAHTHYLRVCPLCLPPRTSHHLRTSLLPLLPRTASRTCALPLYLRTRLSRFRCVRWTRFVSRYRGLRRSRLSRASYVYHLCLCCCALSSHLLHIVFACVWGRAHAARCLAPLRLRCACASFSA